MQHTWIDAVCIDQANGLKTHKTAKAAIINGLRILGKAKQFSGLLKTECFEPNDGWLGQWKK